MVVLAFQLLLLFIATIYAKLSINNSNNIRKITSEINVIDNIQKISIVTSKEIINTTDHIDSDRTEISSQSYHRSLNVIRWKINMFWTIVTIISILWIIILISIIVIVYIRIVYMHHTISQIFCPKE
ncbi:putative integral membrane protein [Brugia pahangi]